LTLKALLGAKSEGGARWLSHRWQIMTAVPYARIKELEATLTEAGEELTSAGILREATGKPHVSQHTGESEWYTPKPIIEAAPAKLDEHLVG
jgi:hypothetical protein